MDRGFTVKGLTVTYMPRGLGEGNADTVQQRARFFGYKESYLGYCRVRLERKFESPLTSRSSSKKTCGRGLSTTVGVAGLSESGSVHSS